MQGSLDTPPILIRTSRIANAIGLAVSAIMAWSGIYIFGIGIVYFCWQLVDPNTLVLAPDGFTWKTSFQRHHWAWNTVSNFRPMPWGQFGWDSGGKSHGSFGFGWEMSPQRLSKLLNSARSRWLDRSSD